MKNSAAKVMIEEQFNLKRSGIEANAEFLMSDAQGYHFEAWWVDEQDVHHQVNMILPDLELRRRNLAAING